MNPKDFRDLVYYIVRQIPAGRVLSYGRIAALTGCPNHARHVGHVLREVPPEIQLPCHRVVNTAGRIAPFWPQQKNLLLAEGVLFKSEMCVDMRQCAWKEEEIMNHTPDKSTATIHPDC